MEKEGWRAQVHNLNIFGLKATDGYFVVQILNILKLDIFNKSSNSSFSCNLMQFVRVRKP